MFTPSKKIACSGDCGELVKNSSLYVIVRGKVLCWPCFSKQREGGEIIIASFKPFTISADEKVQEDLTAQAIAEEMGGFHPKTVDDF